MRRCSLDTRTRLILVEGVPFTGKSTHSEFLATQLQRNGIAAEWVPEGIMLHRHFPQVMAVLDQKQPISSSVIEAEWQGLVQAVTVAGSLFVVDSALSCAAVFPLLAEDRPLPEIHAVLRRIAVLCAPLSPRVVHLIGDVEQLVPASIAQRGEGWREHLVGQSDAAPYQQARGRSGVAGAAQMLADEQALMQSLLQDGDWQTLTLDITAGDWRASEQALLDFMEIPEVRLVTPTLTRAEMEAYAGTYTAEDPARFGGPLSVRLEEEWLALYGRNMRYGTLVAVSKTRFHVQASPLDVEFVTEEGAVQHLLLFTADGATHTLHRM